jgi:hypothetical protein
MAKTTNDETSSTLEQFLSGDFVGDGVDTIVPEVIRNGYAPVSLAL